MIFALNTSSPDCEMYLVKGAGIKSEKKWLAERRLAKGLLGEIEKFLIENSITLEDLKGVIIYRGPGSFTGLRIGVTVANTLADSLDIPIAGELGENWIKSGINRLDGGENDKIVLPEYGAPPHITSPRK